jgi:hypothetical protein
VIGWMLAAQLAVIAHAPDTATACAPIEVSVAARAPGSAAPRLSFPAGGGFQLLRATSTSRRDDDGSGNPFTLTEATFLVATHVTGRVRVPGIVAVAGAAHASSAPLAVTVREASQDDDEPRVLVRARLDDGRGGSGADTLYVGQQVDYVVDVQLNAAARRRLRRNPTFFPPDMPAVLAYDVEPPPPVARSGVHCFESLTYRRALFPLFPGRTAIPPAVLTYALPVSTSFFSREETRELRTDSVAIVALDPPVAGRPADYAGAVGELRASARLEASSARMGDPLVLTLRVEGMGNVKLFPRPPLELSWAAVAPGPERVEVDTSHARVTGAKEFDWLLTPRLAGHVEIPAIRYPYFDPARASYELALTETLGLDVAAASLASADTAVASRLPIRTELRAERTAPIIDHPSYWLLLALAPVPATLRRVRRVRRRHAPGLTPARRLEAAARSRAPVVAREVRRLYLDAIRDRIPSLQPATARAPLARQLRRAGVTEGTAEAAEALLDRLDAVAFSGGGVIDAATLGDAARLAREIDAQAVRVVVRPSSAAWLALIGVFAASALLALPAGVSRTFQDGVVAYRAGNAAAAERQFARVAARAPLAEDAWLNMGTAAWAAGDTARAASRRRRALRLDPLDPDARDRLAMLPPSIAIDARGYVPPMPVGLAAGVALLLWVTAWLALALPPARRAAWVRPVAGGAIVVAVACLAAALELRERLDVQGLGVLRTALTLQEAPGASAGGGAAGIPAAVGEVGLLGAREGAWVRIALDPSRSGWVPTAAVLSLEDAASN